MAATLLAGVTRLAAAARGLLLLARFLPAALLARLVAALVLLTLVLIILVLVRHVRSPVERTPNHPNRHLVPPEPEIVLCVGDIRVNTPQIQPTQAE